MVAIALAAVIVAYIIGAMLAEIGKDVKEKYQRRQQRGQGYY